MAFPRQILAAMASCCGAGCCGIDPSVACQRGMRRHIDSRCRNQHARNWCGCTALAGGAHVRRRIHNALLRQPPVLCCAVLFCVPTGATAGRHLFGTATASQKAVFARCAGGRGGDCQPRRSQVRACMRTRVPCAASFCPDAGAFCCAFPEAPPQPLMVRPLVRSSQTATICHLLMTPSR